MGLPVEVLIEVHEDGCVVTEGVHDVELCDVDLGWVVLGAWDVASCAGLVE